jgi:hypothetical protein
MSSRFGAGHIKEIQMKISKTTLTIAAAAFLLSAPVAFAQATTTGAGEGGTSLKKTPPTANTTPLTGGTGTTANKEHAPIGVNGNTRANTTGEQPNAGAAAGSAATGAAGAQ